MARGRAVAQHPCHAVPDHLTRSPHPLTCSSRVPNCPHIRSIFGNQQYTLSDWTREAPMHDPSNEDVVMLEPARHGAILHGPMSSPLRRTLVSLLGVNMVILKGCPHQ